MSTNTQHPYAQLGTAAQEASQCLMLLSRAQKDAALLAMAAAVREHEAEILVVNALDMEAARLADYPAAFQDRLLLTPERIEAMASGIEKVATLPDPVGEVLAEWTRPNALHFVQRRVPLGVIGFIFESRATVCCDAAALCLKSGNAVILRGGKEARHSNELLTEIMRKALKPTDAPVAAIQLLSGGGREEVGLLCSMDAWVNVIVPRGGKGLIEAVMSATRIPVLKHLDGICHTYVDSAADLSMALNIVDDAKTQRPGVCNALETLLVHRSVAADFLPDLAERMQMRGVECRVTPEITPYFPQGTPIASEQDWCTEYEALILSIKCVEDMQEAIAHINHYGSHHSDAIITANEQAASCFLNAVDSACVYHNASTRFSDGEEFGFGAEIGIGTDKLHARGPMALRELTSYKYVICGVGQVKDASRL